ncbi:MAG: DUF1080 domain-containing protein [Clostridiales bacterium]|nr:DUF1080 domain-containing protein [Clostridiales bacterium]
MKTLENILTTGLILLLISVNALAQDKSVYNEEGYTKLFNGENLAGWKIPEGDNGHWSVINNVIDYDARSEAEGNKDLWSEKEFQDFQLHIEWRFKGYGDYLFPLPTILPSGEYLRDENGEIIEPLGPNADSGILLKGVGQVNLWCWSVGSGELWSVRNNKDLTAEQRAAAVPISNQDQPVGFWNAFDITVKGEYITVKNNGIVVIDHAYYQGLNVVGPIGLQHHGGSDAKTGKLKGASSLVQFRNVWIKEL